MTWYQPVSLLKPARSAAVTLRTPPVFEMPALTSSERLTQSELGSDTGLPAAHSFQGVSQPVPFVVHATS